MDKQLKLAMVILLGCLAILALTLELFAEDAIEPRQKLNLDYDWRFQLGDQDGLQGPTYDDADWLLLDLPHDWSIEGEYSPDNTPQNAWLPGGIGWYRKHFTVPESWINQKVLIQFEGVYMNSDVWLNGHHLGNRPYGYISFQYDLTPYLKKGDNILAVRCDNSLQPSSRWYSGSGIYGHVRLLLLPKLYVIPWGGVFVRPASQSDSNMTELKVSIELFNEAQMNEIEIANRLFSQDGDLVAETINTIQAQSQTLSTIDMTMKVKDPVFWSPDNPYLYRFETILSNHGRIVDRDSFAYGIRILKWDSESGFWLNGINTKLHGVCEHHDGGPVGAAIPDKLLEWRLRLLKEMGCNAIRTAHNPRTPTFYDMCDRIGLLVMDEVFDGWRQKATYDYGARFFNEWWQRDVTDWVRRDRNYACVFLYSIGNETGHTDVNHITDFIHKLDDSRQVTGGTCFYGVDVAGFNGPGGTPGTMEKFRKDNPGVPVILTEEPHTLQTRGFYRVPTWWRDKNNPRFDFEPYGATQIFFDGHERYHSSYDNALVRMNSRYSLKRTESTPWLSGEFRWTGFDCLGEAQFMGAEFCKRIYNPGIIDLAGFPKDSYYLYQSQWTDKPMVHVLPHWTHRHLKEATVIPVVAYSNCQEVELWLNHKSLGRKERGELLDFVWNVPYEPGEMKAVGYQNNTPQVTKIIRTAGDPVAIRLQTNSNNLLADRRDMALVTFDVVDAEDNRVPWASNRIDFSWAGPVKRLGFENGDPMDPTPHRKAYRRTFYGMGRGFFQATDESGPIEMTAAAILGDTLFQDHTQVAIDIQRLSLRDGLQPVSFSIHYTIDDSEPTVDSPLYNGPFVLTEKTTVKALILRDGQPFLCLKSDFIKGAEPRVTDVRFQQAIENTPDPYLGPYDEEIVGQWFENNRIFEFRADGTVHRLRPAPQMIGWWWYDYPNDVFEAENDTGSGELHWKDSGRRSKLKLTTDKKILKVDNRTWNKSI